MKIQFFTKEDYEKANKWADVPFVIEIKRFYLPIIIEGECPNCNASYKFNLDNDGYLSYPEINIPFEFICNCDECGHDWPIMIQLNLSLELVKDNKDAKNETAIKFRELNNEEAASIQFLRQVKAKIITLKDKSYTTLKLEIPKKEGDSIASGTGADRITSFNFTRKSEENK
ncbi:MAG: hypothetical protein ACFFG0_11490 [Candidatus Thorarchaeota archaeon]